ncbi:MAG: hypothetical protein K6G81_01325 [Lachnospiraceae bacterium]|nr:hypothetical protein [Lachnospiraceae bacterium]
MLKNDEFSILNLCTEEEEPKITPSFYQDLNLTRIIDRLVSRWGKDVRKYYMWFPGSYEEEAYRREVFGDIKKEAVYAPLMTFVEELAEIERLRSEKRKVQTQIQKAVWQIRETYSYFEMYEKLEKALEQANLASEGMKSFLRILKEITGDGEYRSIRDKVHTLIKKINDLKFVLTLDKERISVTLGRVSDEEGSYGKMLREKGGKEIKPFLNPFRMDPNLTELEKACLDILINKDRDFYRTMKATAESIEGYEKPVLKRFEQEVIFYLSYLSFMRDMEKEGFYFTAPLPDGSRKMEAKGLYDLALALASLETGKKVIPNDLYYDGKESFFVVTGPNQGGKTTFARSLGQLVYFTKMGLDVPALSANLPFFTGLMTHFSVEESSDTGRGKLKEELVRLAPMMAQECRGAFVVINELFTTAANYDARIMGKKVLTHFMEAECMGIYVTHLKELAEAGEGVVSMKAVLDDQKVQTFKVLRGEADDTPSAENLVLKYRLTYGQLKERL